MSDFKPVKTELPELMDMPSLDDNDDKTVVSHTAVLGQNNKRSKVVVSTPSPKPSPGSGADTPVTTTTIAIASPLGSVPEEDEKDRPRKTPTKPMNSQGLQQCVVTVAGNRHNRYAYGWTINKKHWIWLPSVLHTIPKNDLLLIQAQINSETKAPDQSPEFIHAEHNSVQGVYMFSLPVPKDGVGPVVPVSVKYVR